MASHQQVGLKRHRSFSSTIPDEELLEDSRRVAYRFRRLEEAQRASPGPLEHPSAAPVDLGGWACQGAASGGRFKAAFAAGFLSSSFTAFSAFFLGRTFSLSFVVSRSASTQAAVTGPSVTKAATGSSLRPLSSRAWRLQDPPSSRQGPAVKAPHASCHFTFPVLLGCSLLQVRRRRHEGASGEVRPSSASVPSGRGGSSRPGLRPRLLVRALVDARRAEPHVVSRRISCEH